MSRLAKTDRPSCPSAEGVGDFCNDNCDLCEQCDVSLHEGPCSPECVKKLIQDCRDTRRSLSPAPVSGVGKVVEEMEKQAKMLRAIDRLPFLADRMEEWATTLRATPATDRGEKPTVVCLCGSTRFFKEFMEANYQETMAGRIVLSVGFFPHSSEEAHGEKVGITPEQKESLDELHKRKIDLADEILVLNVGGYIGDSTCGEIEHAKRMGRRIRYLESTTREAPEPEQGKGGADG